jgi:hypothetical protein
MIASLGDVFADTAYWIALLARIVKSPRRP